MKLTSEVLAPYVGGLMDIKNHGEGSIFRGETKTIIVADSSVRVEFNWLAKPKGKGFPPNTWIKVDNLTYAASLEIYAVNNIGPSSVGGGDRLCLYSPVMGEITVIHPPEGIKFDRSRVEGLEPA